MSRYCSNLVLSNFLAHLWESLSPNDLHIYELNKLVKYNVHVSQLDKILLEVSCKILKLDTSVSSYKFRNTTEHEGGKQKGRPEIGLASWM